ncbi:hypothetical protein [Parasitella parasitica]|uniref:Uncharacterized protein n=1 Tax=Parasitella parasitica TaxID=35722 RepID=A0A0B7MX97_9FUNG|nr:hypothetical protein [Parasitella parasitica]
MYRSYHDPRLTRAIARQDEVLEDLIQSTRQVIQQHSTYLAPNTGSDYHRHQHRYGNTHNKPRMQTQTQCTHRCCSEKTKRKPPLKNSLSQPHRQSSQQQPQQPQIPIKSRTKTWFNKIMPSKLQYEIDDEVGLHDLKKKIHKQKYMEQLPHVKTSSRSMIIPSVSSSPEKVVVVDVPADTTVILRSIAADDVKNSQMAAIYHITDMGIINQLFDHVSLSGSKSTGNIKSTADAAHSLSSSSKKMSNSYNMHPTSIETRNTQADTDPYTASSTCSSATLTNDEISLKKPNGMTKYLSMPTHLNAKTQKFNYMDSDASTIDCRGENSPSSLSSASSSLYYKDGKGRMFNEEGPNFQYLKPKNQVVEKQKVSTLSRMIRQHSKHIEDMEYFIFLVNEKGMFVRGTAKQMKIPSSTASNWHKRGTEVLGDFVEWRKTENGRLVGRPPKLTEDHRKYLVKLVDENDTELTLDQMMKSLTTEFMGLQISNLAFHEFAQNKMQNQFKRAHFQPEERNIPEKIERTCWPSATA